MDPKTIKYLMTEQANRGFGREATTPLEDAFYGEVKVIAQDVVWKRVLENVEIRQKLEQLFLEAFKRVFEGEAREKLMVNLAEAVATAFKVREGY